MLGELQHVPLLAINASQFKRHALIYAQVSNVVSLSDTPFHAQLHKLNDVMTSSNEGMKFTIPSTEDVRNYELARETNEPLLFNKQKKKSNEVVKSHHPQGVVDDQTTNTAATNVEVSMTTSTYCITANPVQRQNPVVRFIRNIPVTFDDVVPDFVLGKTTCALFLR